MHLFQQPYCYFIVSGSLSCYVSNMTLTDLSFKYITGCCAEMELAFKNKDSPTETVIRQQPSSGEK